MLSILREKICQHIHLTMNYHPLHLDRLSRRHPLYLILVTMTFLVHSRSADYVYTGTTNIIANPDRQILTIRPGL